MGYDGNELAHVRVGGHRDAFNMPTTARPRSAALQLLSLMVSASIDISARIATQPLTLLNVSVLLCMAACVDGLRVLGTVWSANASASCSGECDGCALANPVATFGKRNVFGSNK